jgi:hypothetical protein
VLKGVKAVRLFLLELHVFMAFMVPVPTTTAA